MDSNSLPRTDSARKGLREFVVGLPDPPAWIVSRPAQADTLTPAVAEELRLLREIAAPVLELYRERAGAWERARSRDEGFGHPPARITITASFDTTSLAALAAPKEGA